MIQHLWLLPVGFAVGVFGTLIGAGGGFVLMPILLLVYPKDGAETLTAISLAVVFFNAFSGSWSYSRMGRIDYRSGFILAAATAPGAVLGALTSDLIPRRTFDALFGVALLAACAFLLLRGARRAGAQEAPAAGDTHRHLVDAGGHSYDYSFNMKIGVALSAIVGYVSSFLGIGGGIIHVPALALVLNFPVHLATATSHFILAFMALAGTVTHAATGSFSHGGVNRTIVLAVGTLLGAPLGAWLSNRIHGRWIIRALAVGLGSVGIRILLLAFE